jgi:pilus assembly protein FimV
LLNDILREPLYLAAGGMVLLGGLLVAMRRRRGSQPKAFKAETAGPALPLGGNESVARASVSDISHTQKKGEPSLANSAAPVIAAPAASLPSHERSASMSPQRAPEALVPARSTAEDNDLDFQAETPGAAPPVTLSAPPASTGAHAAERPPRGTEASASLIERAMDTPEGEAAPGAIPISPMALDPVEPRLSQAASFEKQSPASAAEALPMLDIPKDAHQHAPVPTESEAVPDLEFKLADLDLDVAGKTIPVAEVKDGHWQDVQQKFDLAKAYQEMGDKDGARSILDEVIKEGDTAQQVQARRVLSLLN